MFNVVVRLVPNRAHAEDLLQEAFVKAFSSIDRFDGSRSFGAWLKRIVINTAISDLRRKETKMVEFDDFQHDVAEQDEEALPGLQPEQLHRAIKNLPNGARMVFTLYQIEHYKHQEIAEVLGCSISSSKNQYARARHLLREALKKEYYA